MADPAFRGAVDADDVGGGGGIWDCHAQILQVNDMNEGAAALRPYGSNLPFGRSEVFRNGRAYQQGELLFALTDSSCRMSIEPPRRRVVP